MPRKPAFNIKMTGREYGGNLDVPRSYTQSMTKFQYRDGWYVCRSVNRDHAYMRVDGSKPLLHRGRKNRG